MSDTPTPVRPAGTAGDTATALTPDAIERVLADFRAWLEKLTDPPAPAADPPAVDLHTLVAQFTALRHEINLQTRAARSSLEQTGEALRQLGEAVEELREEPAEDEQVGSLLKALVDVYDNLALALRQVTRQREAMEKPLAELAVPRPPARQRGLWVRLVRPTPTGPDDPDRSVQAAHLVRSALDGLIAGYRMSLARLDRALAQAGLEPIPVEGEWFDPELMEVVEVAGDTGCPPGEVVEEVRRGYRRDDIVFRYAQVKVAR